MFYNAVRENQINNYSLIEKGMEISKINFIFLVVRIVIARLI